MFEHLEHIDDLAEQEKATSSRGAKYCATFRNTCVGLAVQIILAWALVTGTLPGDSKGPSAHSMVARTLVAHTLAGVVSYYSMKPLFHFLTMQALRLTRWCGQREIAQVIYINGILLNEELAAWAALSSCISCPEPIRVVLRRPCLAFLLLLITNGLRKLLEFAFLRSRLRTRFEADVLISAFERAALYRLAELPKDKEAPQVLQKQSVMPDMDDSHAFERYTADMLRTAFGKGSGKAEPDQQPDYSSPMRGRDLNARPASAATFRSLLSSTTMFLMLMEGKFVPIDTEARALFEKLVGSTGHALSDRSNGEAEGMVAAGSSQDLAELCPAAAPLSPSRSSQHPSNEEPRTLDRNKLFEAMPEEDAYRTWQVLTLQTSKEVPTTFPDKCSQQQFVMAVRGIFERFHTLAGTVKDYSAIWLVFSNVLATVQAIVVGLILLAVFFPPEVLRTFCLSISTAFLGFSFVFGGLMKDLFESIVLILVIHPYDVGDRIRMRDLGTGLHRIYTVQKVNILTTEVRDLFNQCVYLKNSHLFQEASLVNMGRSLNAVVELDFKMPSSQVASTHVKQLNDFVKDYIKSHSDIWVPTYFRSFAPVVMGVVSCDLSGFVAHRFRLMHHLAWQNIKEIREDSSKLLYELLGEMRRIGIDFRTPVLPVQLEHIATDVEPADLEAAAATHPISISFDSSRPPALAVQGDLSPASPNTRGLV